MLTINNNFSLVCRNARHLGRLLNRDSFVTYRNRIYVITFKRASKESYLLWAKKE